MTEPVTTIDRRFSDPGTAATPWDETRRVLESAELFWITTVPADGRPHVTPLVAVWLNGAIFFSTGATEQKALKPARQPARNPHHRLQPVGPGARRRGRRRCSPDHRPRRAPTPR
jgi:hypothetical protein